MLEILKEIWRFRQLISLTITGAKISSTMSALQNIDQQVDVLVAKYANARQEGGAGLGKIDEIRAALEYMMAYLDRVAWHTHKLFIVPSANSAMAYSLEMAEAMWARQSLSRIYWLQNDDKLPAPKMPWPRRRAMLVNQRDALTRLGIQMEGAIRRTDQEIVDAVAAEGAVLKAVWDPIVTKEELVMLNDDWTTWANTEKEAREWKARFTAVLGAAKKNIEALSQIIDAGDRKAK